MRIVVTGASGFLGQAVLRCLHARGADAVGVARRAAAGCVTVHHYQDSPAGDVLVHLAGDSDMQRVAAAGAAYAQQAAGLLDALLAKGYSHTVYASSAVLYGDGSQHPRHTGEPVVLHGDYARIKHAGEQAVQAARNGLSVRLANLYGPGMSRSNVVSAILGQIPGQGPLRVRDTRPVRDFLWVADAAEALATMAQHGDSAGVFNLGSGQGVSVGELAHAALAAAGQASRPVESATTPPPLDAPPSTLVLDISATRALFGWRPATPLAEGLRRLLNHNT